MALIRVRSHIRETTGQAVSGSALPFSVMLALLTLYSLFLSSRRSYPIDTTSGVWCGGLVRDGCESHHRP